MYTHKSNRLVCYLKFDNWCWCLPLLCVSLIANGHTQEPYSNSSTFFGDGLFALAATIKLPGNQERLSGSDCIRSRNSAVYNLLVKPQPVVFTIRFYGLNNQNINQKDSINPKMNLGGQNAK